MITTRLRRGVKIVRTWNFVLVPIAVILLLGGFAHAGRIDTAVDRLDAGWTAIRPMSASDAEHAETLDELVDVADLVVVATIREVEFGRTVGDESEPCRYGCSIAYYANAYLDVEDVVAGSPAYQGDVVLDLLMTERDQLRQLQESLPGQRALFILRHKGENARRMGLSPEVQEARWLYYRLVSSQALYRDDGGKVRPPVGAEDEFVLAQRGRGFDALVREVSDLARN